MKKIIAFLLGVGLSISNFSIAFCNENRDFSKEKSLAVKLKQLDLFLGTDNGFELERKLTRTEAVVMMIRTLGKADEAEGYNKTHPFSDVPEWADGYISYAYDKGLTNGVSETLFGSKAEVESNMYLTFVLRAMGFSDVNDEDFTWKMPYALAAEYEMLPPDIELKDFVRADAVNVTCAALFSRCKSGEYLYEKLIKEGAFSEETWKDNFTEELFSEYRTVNKKIHEHFPFKEKTEKNKYDFRQYLILNIMGEENGIRVYVLEHGCNMAVNEKNEIESPGSSGRMWNVLLDKNTYEVISKEYAPYDMKDYFPTSIVDESGSNIWKGMNIVLGKKVEKLIEDGALLYVAPTYEESMQNLKKPESMSIIEKTIETEPCTIVLGYLGGTPHGSYAWLRLVYKPGSEYGEGKVVNLPLPEENGWGVTREPHEMKLSEDGLTLYYSYYFEKELSVTFGIIPRIVHEAGTYNYTVNLVTGEVNLEIVKD